MVTVERLWAEDAGRAAALVARFARGNGDAAQLEQWLSHDHHVMVGAFARADAAGLAWGYVLPRPDDGRTMLLLYGIDVAEEHARLGIGKRLVETLRAAASGGRLWLVTNERNDAAMAFYASLGATRPRQDDVVLHL